MTYKITLKRLPLLEIVIIQKYSRGIPVQWDFHRELPVIKTVASPNSKTWKKRVEEEIQAFNVWKHFNPSIPFKNLRWNDVFHAFLVDVNIKELFGATWNKKEWITISIVVPRTYPRAKPQWGTYTNEDYIFQRLVYKATGGAPFCIPPVFYAKLRRLGPHAGIVHFLDAFLTWISLFRKLLKVME